MSSDVPRSRACRTFDRRWRQRLPDADTGRRAVWPGRPRAGRRAETGGSGGIIHNATLLHDDVIDESDKSGAVIQPMRCGAMKRLFWWGISFARAFELMVETDDITVLGMLSSASARITEGEVKQMTMAGQPDAPLADYMSVITNKTAILFAAAAESGARVGGADASVCAALHEYGLGLGRAFQIMDDALDYVSDSTKMGNAGDDFNDGKITMPVIRWGSDTQERAFWQRTLGDGDIHDGDLQMAQDLLRRHSAIDQSLDAAKAEAETAVAALAPVAEGPLKEALCQAAFLLTQPVKA